MATLPPRVFPGTRRGERKGSPRCPAGRSGDAHMRHCIPVGQADTGFPDPNLHLGRSEACDQTDHTMRQHRLEASMQSHHGTTF
uniref:Uncharacterized protein n=1 Tax=Hordeum vulgare subsp. vulgare TaxID=112509 RepID=A0A023INK6_HORVV|nr:hypothetical protein [Hordeum vulgare subsp. vulgare]